MAAAGYTTVYNDALRDPELSLQAKGLYALIKSFIGLEGFQLSKRRLAYACSDSSYMLNSAWKELKIKGYLQHYYSTSETGAFCHVYNLLQQPGEPAEYSYSPNLTRSNGDCTCIITTQSDYTNISTNILRDKTISLASKGLFALVTYLLKIPGFLLRPEGIRSFCREKIKHFSTLWKRFKISGLLKQHRFPSDPFGEESHWTYEYELCETPDLETPYLTNYRADGSVSTVATIDSFLDKVKKRVAHIRKNKRANKHTPRPIRRKLRKQIETQVNADTLRQQFGGELTGTIVTAIYNIKYADKLRVKGTEITQESREQIFRSISQETITRFLNDVTIDYSHVKDPTAYLQTSLYTYHQKLLLQSSQDAIANADTPDRPLADWEKIWLAQMADARRRRKEAIARGEYPEDQE